MTRTETRCIPPSKLRTKSILKRAIRLTERLVLLGDVRLSIRSFDEEQMITKQSTAASVIQGDDREASLASDLAVVEDTSKNDNNDCQDDTSKLMNIKS